jgi:hypothetical protein
MSRQVFIFFSLSLSLSLVFFSLLSFSMAAETNGDGGICHGQSGGGCGDNDLDLVSV